MQIKLAAALFAALLISGCGALMTPPPTADDLRQSLSNSAFLEGALSDCHAGEQEGHSVQSCHFCIDVVEQGDIGRTIAGGGGVLGAFHKTGNVVFRRALSHRQADIEPARGEPGVWHASDIDYDSDHYRGPQLSSEEMAQVGYRQETPQSFMSIYGPQWPARISDEVRQTIESSAALKEQLLSRFSQRCTGSIGGNPHRPNRIDVSALERYVGSDFPSVSGIFFTDVPQVRNAVAQAVADGQVSAQVLSAEVVTGPVAKAGGYIRYHACEPHNCGDHNWSILIKEDGSATEICYYEAAMGANVRWYADGRSPQIRPWDEAAHGCPWPTPQG